MNATVTKSTRGRKPLNVKLPQGAFTIGQFFGMNDKSKGGVMKCELTARNHVNRGVQAGLFVKLPEKARIVAPGNVSRRGRAEVRAARRTIDRMRRGGQA